MEGAAHGGHVARVVGGIGQAFEGCMGVGDDLARFLDEDLAHFRVFFEPGATHGHRGRWRDGCRRRQFFRPGARQVDQHISQVRLHIGTVGRALAQGSGRPVKPARQVTLIAHQGQLRNTLQLLDQRRIQHFGARCGFGQREHLLQQGRRGGRLGCGHRRQCGG